jgi:Protein of unknown function (DUF3833)
MMSPLLAYLLLVQTPGAGMEQFFVGRTQGAGTAHVIMSGSHGVSDRGRGWMEGTTLVLQQVVQEQGKPARSRTWRLTRAGNRISGSISDARGPVQGEVNGNVVRLRYSSAEGPSVEQWITFNAGGRTASNRMVFRRFGVEVGRLEGTIRRVD